MISEFYDRLKDIDSLPDNCARVLAAHDVIFRLEDLEKLREFSLLVMDKITDSLSKGAWANLVISRLFILGADLQLLLADMLLFMDKMKDYVDKKVLADVVIAKLKPEDKKMFVLAAMNKLDDRYKARLVADVIGAQIGGQNYCSKSPEKWSPDERNLHVVINDLFSSAIGKIVVQKYKLELVNALFVKSSRVFLQLMDFLQSANRDNNWHIARISLASGFLEMLSRGFIVDVSFYHLKVIIGYNGKEAANIQALDVTMDLMGCVPRNPNGQIKLRRGIGLFSLKMKNAADVAVELTQIKDINSYKLWKGRYSVLIGSNEHLKSFVRLFEEFVFIGGQQSRGLSMGSGG